MALDGILLHSISLELRAQISKRIDRIFQPSKEELILTLRGREGMQRLLISANAMTARIHITQQTPQNPKSPPMFCMLLRKHLTGAKLVDVRQQELDRVLFLDFQTHNRLGDAVSFCIAVEIMGKHSNIILIDQEGKVVDAIKRVSEEVSSVRPIFPGKHYHLPPGQEKWNILTKEGEENAKKSASAEDGTSTSQWLMEHIQGISPLAAREFDGFSHREALLRLRELLADHRFAFCLLYENKKPVQYSWLDLCQYGDFYQKQFFTSAGLLLDAFYKERDLFERMKQKSSALQKALDNAIARTAKKLQIRQSEWKQTKRRDEFLQYGDLLNANLSKLQKGQTSALLEDFTGPFPITIPLDASKTPAENAQKYYREYKKSVRARQALKELIRQAEEELDYLESVQDALQRARRLEDVEEIKGELAQQGMIKASASKKKAGAENALPPYRYCSSDGFLIQCGRNNRQNDILTLKMASKEDIWFHTQKIHGSHVILFTQGRQVPERSIREACEIAACHSKGRDSAQVPVDYTYVKYVKKPAGAKPGMVILTHNKTIFVRPDREKIKTLQKEEKGI